MRPHRRYHNYEFKCQWISHYPFIYENEWNHNSYENYQTDSNVTLISFILSKTESRW